MTLHREACGFEGRQFLSPGRRGLPFLSRPIPRCRCHPCWIGAATSSSRLVETPPCGLRSCKINIVNTSIMAEDMCATRPARCRVGTAGLEEKLCLHPLSSLLKTTPFLYGAELTNKTNPIIKSAYRSCPKPSPRGFPSLRRRPFSPLILSSCGGYTQQHKRLASHILPKEEAASIGRSED